jgi:hypothetical protein
VPTGGKLATTPPFVWLDGRSNWSMRISRVVVGVGLMVSTLTNEFLRSDSFNPSLPLTDAPLSMFSCALT